MSYKTSPFYSVKMSLLNKKIVEVYTHLFHDPIDMGTPASSGHLFLPEIIPDERKFPSQDYTRGGLPISIGFRGINVYKSGISKKYL